MARKEGSESRYPPLKNSSPGVHNGASAGRVACTGERERVEREKEGGEGEVRGGLFC